MFGFLGALKNTDLFSASEIAFFQKVWPTIRIAARWTDPNWASIGYPNGPPVTPLTNSIMLAVWSDVRRAAQFSDINWDAVPELTQAMIVAAEAVNAPAPSMVVTAPAPVTQPVPEVIATPSQPTMRTPETAPGAVNPTLDTSTPPAAAPVPEVTTPGYTAAPSAVAAPTPGGYGIIVPDQGYGLPPLYGPADTSGGSMLVDASGNPIPTAAAPIQAGMFGDMKTWLLVSAAGLGIYLLSKKGGKFSRRRRRRA